MIQVVDPKIGETVYDGAVGSAGFLCEANEYMTKQAKNTEDLNTLQKSTFYGKEKKGLAYVIGIMNLILHGIDAPNIVHTNTLNENVMDIKRRTATTWCWPIHPSVAVSAKKSSKTSSKR